MTALRSLSLATVRQLAVACQNLHHHQEEMLATIRQIGCLQLDPTSAVQKNHLLVLWSRLGNYDLASFDRLIWADRQLFEYWAHAASIVLTENYPLHRLQMRHHQEAKGHSHDWFVANAALYQHVVDTMRERGAVQLKELEGKDKVQLPWFTSGWTSGRDVDRMMDYLWVRGHVMVSGRRANARLWDLAERVLPEWTPREELPDHEIVRRAVLIALNALGVATPKHINFHFMRGYYPKLKTVLEELVREGHIERVAVTDNGQPLKGDWYLANRAVLAQVEQGQIAPRTTLLSPFDNLIADRGRTEQLWDFRFRLEIYTPKDKREYGYFVMPILHGANLIGRIDPLYDRKTQTLIIHAIHWEQPPHAEQRQALQASIESLATWLGAKQVQLPR